MNDSVSGARRRGRVARVNARLAPDRPKAVAGGLTGGALKPLSAGEVERVHRAALEVLETIGVGDPSAELLDLVLPKGCFLGPRGRLCFPPALVEDTIAPKQRDFTIYARGPRAPDWDVHIGGDRVYTAIGAESVAILDAETRTYRPTTLVDLYDLARLTDALDNIHLAGQMAHCSDVEGIFEQDINTIYALAAGTSKPFTMSFRARANIAKGIELFDTILGGEGRFAKRPFCTFGPISIVSPLRFEAERLGILIEITRRGLVNDASTAPLAGATGPAPLAGTLVQATAEMLASITIVKLINRDSAVFFAPWPFIADLRTGAFASGSGEGAVLGAAMAQMGKYYGLPTSQGACMTDSKIPDAQAGFEKATLAVLAAQAGTNRIKCAGGMLGSIKCCSFEAMVIDNDLLGLALRGIRGIEVTDETLSVEAIRDVVMGEGHYLGHPQTLAFMETEYAFPALSDRGSVEVWEEAGSPTLFERARVRSREILASHYPGHLDGAADVAIRAAFPIALGHADMGPESGRWRAPLPDA